VAIPAIVISGPVYARVIRNVRAKPLEDFVAANLKKPEELPGLAESVLTALLPVILIGFCSVGKLLTPPDTKAFTWFSYFSNPALAMLISVLVAIWFLGIRRGRKMQELMQSLAHAVSGLTMVMLIIAGAGALKQVLVDSGVNEYIGKTLAGTGISPLILGWLIATVLRVALGSATVAGITTAGIVLPLVQHTHVVPELMVLAIGSGSIMLAHVNDGGFWLVKEYFNLSIRDTFRTWTVMETSIGITGLAGVLFLSLFIK